ncbi:hypothetical protein [Brevundimonas sp. M20]|uniref:hypothetical protein n=1 Tax=Brevundimonas sp. M20 TaxID=2591463 RepID=UPI00114785EF|nr:hypothetical protein [Brevundimonas sp. M20]QDH72162.1 hypothetical protein FKQ52_01245 [Brevundimonas sp. M20]
MRLPILLSAAVLLVAACSQQPAEPAAGAGAAGPAAEATPDPVMPADAPPQEETTAPTEASSMSCTLDQGADGAAELAARCTRVSPASHPPCNPDNPCQMIQDEIDRSCAMYKPGETKPAECTG